MQINKDFQGKTSIAKKNDGSIKNASFPSKYNAKENNEFYQDSSLKPFQYSNKKNVNTDVSKSPTLRIKKSKIQVYQNLLNH